MVSFFPELHSLADFTNTASISVIILCSVGMILFIYVFRLAGDLSHRTVDFRPRQRNMVKVSNPFVLELDDSTKQLGDVLKLNLSTLCPCHLVVVWGPDIQAFHDLILTPGRSIKKKVLADLTQNTDLRPLHVDQLRVEAEGKHALSLSTPECVSSEALGDMPRSRYPLAVFIFTPERTADGQNCNDNGDCDGSLDHDNGEEKDNDIIGLFVIVHLKDDTVTKDSHIIGKYVKTAGVPIYSLQALFVSTTEQPQPQPPQHDGTSYEHSSSSSGNLRHRNNSRSERSTSEQTRRVVNSSDQFVQSDIYPLQGEASLGYTPPHSKNDAECSSKSNDGETSHDSPGLTDPRENCGLNELTDCDCSHSNNDDLTQRSNSHEDSDASLIPDCVVCQTQPAVCALLPCRHNCVCIRCFRLLDNKCPMCRSGVESYFIVGGGHDGRLDNVYDEENEREEEENDQAVRQGIAGQVENMFERVNQMVGFA